MQTSKQQQQITVELNDLVSNRVDAIRVLHVDDEASILEISKVILMEMGNFEIEHAYCVDEALKKLEACDFDVVVSDYEMPQKDGLQFLKELREARNEIPFILFTGKGREEVAVKALNLGADGYINKQGQTETVYGELLYAIKHAVIRKQAEKKLIESGIKYRSIFNNSEVGMFRTRVDGSEILDFNEKFLFLFGRTSEEMQSTPSVIHWADPNQRKKMVSILKSKGEVKDFECKILTKQGDTRICLTSARLFAKEGIVEGSIIDITERKKAEEALRRSEEKYREFANALPEIVFEADLTGKITFFSQHAFKITGFDKEDIMGKNMLSFVIPEERERAAENIKKSVVKGYLGSNEYTLLRKNGSTYPALIRATPIIVENKVLGLRAIVVDISDRKRIDVEKQEKYEALERVAESIGAGLAVIDRKYNVFWANSTLRNLGNTSNKKCYQTFNHLNTVCPDCGVKKIFEQNLPFDAHEYKTIDSKGETAWIELRVTPLKDKNGNVTAALELAVPITERKKAEQEFADLARFPSENPNIVMRISKDGPILYANDAAKQFFTNFAKSKLCAFQQINRLTTNVLNSGLRKKVVVKLGNRSFLFTFSPILDRAYVNVYGFDITNLKKAEKALSASKKNFQAITYSIRDAIIVVDDQAKVTYWNPAAEKIFGYSKNEAVGQDVHQLVVPPTMSKTGLDFIKVGLKKFSKTGEGNFTTGNVELIGLHKDGREFPAKISLSPLNLGGKWTAVGVVKDMTERKQAEQKLKDAEQRYRTIFNQAPLGVVVIDPQTGKIVEFNDVAHTQLGYSREEFSKLHISDFEATKTADEIKTSITKILTTKEDEFETKHKTKNGKIRNVIVTVKTTELAGKVFFNCIFYDITETRKIQNALAESESKYRQLVNVAQEGIWAFDNNYCTVFANSRLAKILGYSESELVGKNLRDFLLESKGKKSEHLLREYDESVSDSKFEYKLKRKDNSWIFAGIVASPLKDDDGNVVGTLALVSDVTYRKALEKRVSDYAEHLKCMVDLRTVQLKDANERLVKAERLAAIGELAGMVGHDLRNPLAGIKNATFLLKKKAATISEAQAKEMLEIIDKAIDHSDKIINDLLEYAREMHLELAQTTLQKLLEETFQMINVPEKVKILNKVQPETLVRVDVDKIMRVFLNLVRNAIDAMPNGGTLEISSCQTNDCVELAFADTGKGVPSEVLPKIFTPLFTTKAQGMGFGLAICKRVIEAHGGTISVETKLNKGTTFTITIPTTTKQSTS